MGGLDISEVTIGYSSTGAQQYVSDLNTAAIDETNGIISDGVQNITDTLQRGWQGQAYDAFAAKLNEVSEQLKDKLQEMKEVFNATMAAQEQTYHEEDQSMSEDISATNVF